MVGAGNPIRLGMKGVGKKAVRYRSIDPDFWNAASIHPVWDRTKKAWISAIKQLKDYGIVGNALFPADNALVTLVDYSRQIS